MGELTTKRQQALLQFIADFITEHNYAPSYREIMKALGYKSVSTVAIHVNGLIAKGYLTKTDKSARSIRVVKVSDRVDNNHLAWLRNEITKRETAKANEAELEVLRKALDILGGESR